MQRFACAHEPMLFHARIQAYPQHCHTLTTYSKQTSKSMGRAMVQAVHRRNTTAYMQVSYKIHRHIHTQQHNTHTQTTNTQTTNSSSTLTVLSSRRAGSEALGLSTPSSSMLPVMPPATPLRSSRRRFMLPAKLPSRCRPRPPPPNTPLEPRTSPIPAAPRFWPPVPPARAAPPGSPSTRAAVYCPAAPPQARVTPRCQMLG